MNLNAFDFDRSASKKRLKIKIRPFKLFSPLSSPGPAPWVSKNRQKSAGFFFGLDGHEPTVAFYVVILTNALKSDLGGPKKTTFLKWIQF